MKKIIVGLLLLCCYNAHAQLPGKLGNLQRLGQSSTRSNTNKGDSLGLDFEHRDDAKDSINLSYKFLDSTRSNVLDSSINDFYKYFSVSSTQQYLGNNGAPGYSIIYAPFMKAGWDAGFHAYDSYRFTTEGARFFKTTKPFSQIKYQLASGKEQMINVLHTQNPRPNLNVGFEYRLINAPGFFKTQNTIHNNYRIFGNYLGKRKRYGASLILTGNVLKASENGGIKNDSLLYDPTTSKRFSIPVNLGGDVTQFNPFNATINTGNTYKDFNFFFRQTYDVGKKDSVEVNDSTTEYLFYPKLRFQYTFNYSTYSYQFKDVAADSVIYANWYDTTLKKAIDTFRLIDKWKVVSNDLSLIQFPDTKNASQFFLAGARLENITGDFLSGTRHYYNIILHGEYRNKTRNKLWDILARGEFYMNGLNSGDYSAYGTLARFLNKRWGNVRLTFNNVNRSPSFIYTTTSSFNLDNGAAYKKENITLIKATADNPFISLYVANYFIANLLYFNDYHHADQYSKLVNLLQAGASKKIRVGRKWNWYADVVLQQTDGAAPVKVPLLFTRNRLAYEGLFYKNLQLSTGLEFRYYSHYSGYNYSPVMGQFMTQDTVKLKNLPDVAAFMHFRIKSFTAFIRAENLNAVNFANGFDFTNNNFAAPHYVYPGFVFRLGIQWGFVN